MMVRAAVVIVALVLVTGSPGFSARDQSLSAPALFDDLTWRPLGPFHGGRVTAAACVPSNANLFYIGTANGGVWRTTDAGQSWQPIFEDQAVGSIGALAVAPSDARVIYVGTGAPPTARDAVAGDGLYRSQDGGRTWTPVGLAASHPISRVVVHPREAGTIYVAALGPAHGDGEERGVFRSTYGGRSF